MTKIIIDSGHFNNDVGATFGEYTERDICKKIRDEVKRLMPNVICVPDEFNLRQSIDWVNQFVNKDDLCISIHLNHSNDYNRSGCEGYFSDVSYLANIFSKHVSRSLGVPNLGAMHDSKTYVGSLGWLRQIKAQNVLVEACYLSNYGDRMKIIMPSGQTKAAQGIVNAINEHINNLTILGQLKNIVNRLLALIK